MYLDVSEVARLPQQSIHIRGLGGIANLENKDSFGDQKISGLGGNAGIVNQPVLSPIQRQVRFVVAHFGFECGNPTAVDVWRVAENGVEAANRPSSKGLE